MASHSSGEAITIQKVTPRERGRMELRSGAVDAEGRIADLHSSYHDNISPALEWTGIPEAESFALVVEDPDAPMDKPVVHWLAWNIPGSFEGLPSGIAHGPVIDAYGGLVQGRNTHGQHGYMGPRPPPGDGPHRYHFQLFALDKRLDLRPDAPLEELVNVLRRDAIASCELVGTYERADPASPAAPQPGERSFAGRDDSRGGLDEDDVDRHAPHDPDGVLRPGA